MREITEVDEYSREAKAGFRASFGSTERSSKHIFCLYVCVYLYVCIYIKENGHRVLFYTRLLVEWCGIALGCSEALD